MYSAGKVSSKCAKLLEKTWLLSFRRSCNTRSLKDELKRQRNIGIVAHVDAGKTTTTERMLFYSGEIASKGEVHHGNTVTDYLVQERDRGISITSAFVKFKWKNHVLNLVDTPGHIDFTAEVENALGVIDSAILLLDSSAGVEAQTSTVWNQLRDHNLPCLVYINKMDRSDANVDLCLQSLRDRLHCEPLSVQIPVLEQNGSFVGVVDLPSMDCITWTAKRSSQDMVRKNVTEGHPLYELTVDSRNELIDRLSSLDDELANSILETGSLEAMSATEIVNCIRRVTILGKAVPVVCGSSYKDIGVQPLLDAVVDFLPSPYQTKLDPSVLGKSDQLLKSFKVMHDKQRGPITFLRVYSGEISKGQRIYNASKDKIEQVGKILVPFADDFEEVSSASMGQYVAITGLKYTHPGELLCNSAGALKRIRSMIKNNLGLNGEEIDRLLRLTNRAPHPVFFCSVEVSSQVYQQTLERALAELQREDSSLGVTYDAETGQTVLSGMGELHLDIIKDRLKTNYKLDVDVGKVQIMYKEKIEGKSSSSYHLVNSIGSQQYEVLIKLTLIEGSKDVTKILVLDNSSESAANLAHISHKQLGAIERGIKAALSRGPVMGYQVIESQATLHWLESKRSVPDQLLSAAASYCVGQILKESKMTMLEPIMSVDITIPEERLNLVLADLNRRRAVILNVESRGENKVVQSEVPTAELVGYSSTLRTITSGTASLLMTFVNYKQMTDAQVDEMKNYGSYRNKIR